MNNIGSTIDHTILKADAKKEDIEQLCSEAKTHNFAAVCVNPSYISLCKELLKDTDVKVATVVGFPLGATSIESKVFETLDAINKGADEIDMVINISALKNRDYDYLALDIKKVVEASSNRAIVKVIIETCLLSEEEKVRACELSMDAGAHYVKTSTGFSTGGATVEDVKLMKSIVKDRLKVKASGGIKDLETAKKMIEAGASRLGTSSGVKIVSK